jgi:hypothetical protein
MSPMARIILVKENTKKKEDFGSLLPPREGSWTPTNKLFLLLEILKKLRGGVNQLFISLKNFMPFKIVINIPSCVIYQHTAYGQ